MEDRLGRWSTVGKGLEVGHDVVPGALLVLAHPIEILRGHLEVGQHLVEGVIRDLETLLLFGRSQSQPEPSPGGVARAGGEQALHLLGRVAAGERVVEAIERGHISS